MARIRRYTEKAYAYLLLPEHVALTAEAQRRLWALQKYTELGAGFKIAMKDLELRGAGNLLGTEQHGYIHAVGFDLYCRLLRDTVAELKADGSPQRRARLSASSVRHRRRTRVP